uniref:Uncharacterized protein n=1 Tax=Siphoviridae sp. ctTrD1 TaxID=2825524 RepID=A0A8S5PP52_9CAUD|nr:MAG TPA: hypothetical protein [Siphoviridae sp. ctTrD1]
MLEVIITEAETVWRLYSFRFSIIRIWAGRFMRVKSLGFAKEISKLTLWKC